MFDTIAAEAGAELNETYPPFTRNRLPKWTRPDVGSISGLSPVIVIDQRRLSGNARSTVGTITDTWTYLRLLFSRLSEQPDWLSADPTSVTYRALTHIPSGEMLVFDLAERDEGYPLGASELGFPEDAVDIGLTMSEYLALANELALLEAKMFAGHYPYEEIVAAFERRGLDGNGFWSEYLETLAESRDDTAERVRHLKGG